MGFNMGSFMGGAADGYRKQMEEQRKKEAADREKKVQDRQDKEWQRQDDMQAELDASQKAWEEKYNPENQRKAFDEQQNKTSSGAAISEAMNAQPATLTHPMLDKPKTDAEILQNTQQQAPIAPPKSVMGGKSGEQAMQESLTMPKPAPQPASEFQPTQPTFIDRMNYMADRVAIKAKYGKASEAEQIQMYQTIKTLKDEGVDNAVAKMHAGDVQGALKDFNDVGQYRGAKLVGEPQQSTYKVGGQDIPTTIVTLALPDGTQQTINTAEYGMARVKMDKAFQLSMEGRRVGLEGQRVDLQREANAETAKNNTAKLGLEWWKAKNPSASGENATAEIRNAKAFFPDLYAQSPAKALAAFKDITTGEMTAAKVRQTLLTAYTKDGWPDEAGTTQKENDAFLNERVKFVMGKPGESGNSEQSEKPPVAGARKAKDGKWYIQKDGKTYLVE